MEINLSEIRVKNIQKMSDHSLIDLPLLDHKKINFRELKEVGARAIILVEFKSLTIYPEDKEEAIKWMEKINLFKYFSPNEEKALKKVKFSSQEEIDFSWYEESLTAILWILGYISSLPKPTEEFDIEPYVDNLPPTVDLGEYLSNLSFISQEKIIEELDYYYLLHWLCRKFPEKFNLSVVRERRKLLEWIVDQNLSWDDVPLDT